MDFRIVSVISVAPTPVPVLGTAGRCVQVMYQQLVIRCPHPVGVSLFQQSGCPAPITEKFGLPCALHMYTVSESLQLGGRAERRRHSMSSCG